MTSTRIGQIAGGHGGSWATTDWFPIIVKSSIAPGALPEAAGVSDRATCRYWSCVLMNDPRAYRDYARKMSLLPFWRRRLSKKPHRPHSTSSICVVCLGQRSSRSCDALSSNEMRSLTRTTSSRLFHSGDGLRCWRARWRAPLRTTWLRS